MEAHLRGELLAGYLADRAVSRSWRGLWGDDARLFAAHLEAGTLAFERMYCYVPVGDLPPGLLAVYGAGSTDPFVQIYYKRIDVVLEDAGGFVVCELKPAAGYVALGQVLTYQALAMRDHPCLERCRAAVITDCPDPDAEAVFRQFGVEVLALPGRPYVPLDRPT